MKKFTRKQKIVLFIAGLVVVCGLATGVMYITGVLPIQAQGVSQYGKRCHNKYCACHEPNDDSLDPRSSKCGRCQQCFYTYK